MPSLDAVISRQGWELLVGTGAGSPLTALKIDHGLPHRLRRRIHPAHPRADLPSRNGRHLVHHHLRNPAQPRPATPDQSMPVPPAPRTASTPSGQHDWRFEYPEADTIEIALSDRIPQSSVISGPRGVDTDPFFVFFFAEIQQQKLDLHEV